MSLSDLNIRIGADIQQFTTAIQQVERQLKRVGREMMQTGTTMTQAFTLPLAGLAAVSLKAYGDMDTLKRGLIAVTGSASEAEKEFSKLREVAKLPGLGLNEAVRGSINLQAIGLSADEARKAMLAMGNAIATVGGGKVNFDLAIRGFSQLANAAKPMQQDLNQILGQLPQASRLLIEAFGTNRAEELANMGLSGRQVADFLVEALSKLPPVTGGFNNALENLGDTLKVTAGEFGEIINKAFGVEDILNSISESVEYAVKWFKSLSPETQRFALMAGAVLAAVGPLLVALGFLASSVIPALISGFGLLLGPVGLVIAAIAGAAYLIISNWETIKEYFTNGGGARFLDGVMEVVTSAYEFFATIFGLIYDKVTEIWDSIGYDLFQISKSLLGTLVDMFAEGLSLVADVFDFLRSASEGDMEGMGNALINIGKSIVNGLIMMFQGLLRVLGPIMAKIFEVFGADKMAADIRNLSSGLANYVEQFKFMKPEVDKATKSLKQFQEVASGGSVGDSGGGGKNPPIVDENELSKQKKLLESVKFTTPYESVKPVGFDPSLVEDMADPYMDAQLNIDKAMYQTRVKQNEHMTAMQDRLTQFANQVPQVLSMGAQNIVGGMGEILAGMMDGSASIADVPKLILGTIADMATQLGKMAIGIGFAVEGIKKALSPPLNPAIAIAAGVALVGLGAAARAGLSKINGKTSGKAMNTGVSIPKFASGGLAYGPTLAMVGDNRNAGRDPEMIAPFSKVQSMFESIYGGGGMGTGQVTFVISGTNLVGVLDNVNKQKRRTA